MSLYQDGEALFLGLSHSYCPKVTGPSVPISAHAPEVDFGRNKSIPGPGIEAAEREVEAGGGVDQSQAC